MNSTLLQILIILLLVAISAFFSSAETAYSTVSQIRLKSMADEGNKKARAAMNILSQYSKMLSAILIMNNIVNLSASALMTAFIINTFGENLVSAGTAILTVLVILFGEITPKNISNLKAEEIALADAGIIGFTMTLLTPVISLVDFLSGGILKVLGIDKDQKKLLTESDLKTYVEVGQEDGAIEKGEKKLIYNVFDFGDSVAKDIMVPRIDMACVSIDASYDEVMQVFRKDMFTRIPVYENDPDKIVGHINIKDFILLPGASRFNMKKLIHESYFTYEYKSTAALMKEMQQHSFGVAFVLDEFGTTVGMITLEDLVEEIVGEIRDEYDEDEKQQIRKYDDLTYLVDGSMKLIDLNDQLDTSFHSEDYDSIGGLIIEKLERLPANGESVTLDDGTQLQAKGVHRNRIVKVLIRFALKEEENTDQSAEPAKEASKE